jgi:bifunctional polynucleotide phosphatase/kinase
MAQNSGASALDAINLDSDDEAPPPKRQATDERSALPPPFTLPASTQQLRGVRVPAGWSVHGGSLLVMAHRSPTPAAKVAAFDFDNCLAATRLGSTDPSEWKMQFPHVPSTLHALAASGHTLVVISNESMDRLKKPEAISNAVNKKCGRLQQFAERIDLPMLLLCATAKDAFRKPETGAWDFFTRASASVQIDYAKSFYVGDAAGRPNDHSDSDRVFAANARLPFFDETTFFLKMHPPGPVSTSTST